jgi:hypothetical protein
MASRYLVEIIMSLLKAFSKFASTNKLGAGAMCDFLLRFIETNGLSDAFLDAVSAKKDSASVAPWLPMKDAPKGATPENPCKEIWILGANKFGEQRVIRWCMEYPCNDGCWMFAYAPTDEVDIIQEFDPVKWMPLPKA